jgi:hypothetical protein
MNNQPEHKTDDFGDQSWRLNGKFHREDGPAMVTALGSKKWFVNGELHREDGPAIEWVFGEREWWFRGSRLKVDSQEEFEKILPMLQIKEAIDE